VFLLFNAPARKIDINSGLQGNAPIEDLKVMVKIANLFLSINLKKPVRELPMIGKWSKQQLVILGVLIGIVIISLILRILPFFQMDFTAFAVHGDPDVWYNFRQIEVMVSDFARYNWFDPMTAYPVGKYIDWGPLFPMIASVFCLLTGAVQRVDLIAVSSRVPILFGILMIPVVFLLARQIAGWKAGVIAAILIAVVSGEYFYRTMAGVVDHHCAEVFFTTVFCLFYIWAIRKGTENEVNLRIASSLKPVIIPSVIAGVAFAAGLAVMPTTILFAMIVAFYTLFLYLWNEFHGKRTEYLLVANGIISICAIAGLAFVGIHSPTYSLATYSAAPMHAFIMLFIGTALLQIFSMASRGKPWIFTGLVVLAAVVGIGIAALASPSAVSSGIGAVSSFFGQSFREFPIDEQKPWTLGHMWASYNIGMILALIGLILLGYQFLKKECPAHLFVLVWGVVVLVSTIQHSRFEYYSAVIVVISAAFALGYAFILDKPGPGGKTSAKSSRDQKGKKEKRKKEDTSRAKKGSGIFSALEGTGTSLVLACMVIFCGVSLISDYSIATSATKANLIPPQWTGTLGWINGVAPPTGISYLGPYISSNWSYPPGSYSILSWWDYGHWITFLSKRIPVTNPFQDNVVPSALYFFAESEEAADTVADKLDSRYIITDWKMVDTKFPSMVTWYKTSLTDETVPDNYYYRLFRVAPHEGEPNQTLANLHFQPYYQTMVSRLQNFDGTMVEPGEVVYIEYDIPASRSSTPGVYRYEVLDITTARQNLALFESNLHEGKGAAIVNTGLTGPVEKIPALRHYRLIYEQANETVGTYTKAVKTFEYVSGAKLKGEGRIEVTIQTNLGRTFIYRQDSENGLFILPYATKDTIYPVKTVGPYRLVPSGRTIEVSEQEVRDGATILG
jgi:dolichyl-diphosphooligosaccharide--protein glycosyltransferase